MDLFYKPEASPSYDVAFAYWNAYAQWVANLIGAEVMLHIEVVGDPANTNFTIRVVTQPSSLQPVKQDLPSFPPEPTPGNLPPTT